MPVISSAELPRGRGRAWSLLPPLLAFLVVNAVLLGAAVKGGFDYFDPGTWAHWDSVHYLSIADRGYDYIHCLRFEFFDLTSVFSSIQHFLGVGHVRLEDVCGNAGWFPGYPALIRTVSASGLSSAGSGVLLAVGFQLATLCALWIWFLSDRPVAPALISLTAGAFFFGHVYYRAIFPMSLVTLLVLAHLYSMGRDRWLVAGVTGAAAAFSYPTAFLLAPIGLGWLATARPDLSVKDKISAASQIVGLTLAGFAAVMWVQWLYTGVWGAFFDVQRQFGYGINVPTTRLQKVVAPLFADGLSLHTVPNLQTVLVALTMVAVCVVAARKWHDLSKCERWVAIFSVVFWIFPLTLGGKTSLYRIDSVLLPAVILFPRMPVALQAGLACVLVVLSYPMALQFFRNVLI